MKNNMKRILLTVVAAMLLVVMSVGVTLAYLTATTNEVTNTFSVGKVTFGSDLREGLDEALVNEYGEPITDEASQTVTTIDKAPRVEGNDYKLIAGHTYTKDPTVTIGADSEECYVRMLVTVTDMTDLKTIFPDDVANGVFLLQNFVGGWNSNVWKSAGIYAEDAAADSCTYEFRYYTTVSTVDAAAQTLEPLFTSFTLPEGTTNAEISKLTETSADVATNNDFVLSINVIAHAIQEDGFADEDEAWDNWN